MAIVRYVGLGEALPRAGGRQVLVTGDGTGGQGRGNNLAGAPLVSFVAPGSTEGQADAIQRAVHYADGCGIAEVFVRRSR